MKKLYLFVVFVLAAFLVNAQENTSTMDDTNLNPYDQYNHWSIEATGGLTNAVTPRSSGYHSKALDFGAVDLGVRYMANELFGVKADLGYNRFKSSGSSLPYKTTMYRAGLEGVVNGGTLLGFRDWTNTFNFLLHGGAGYAHMKYDAVNIKDDMGYLTAGITPQLRLSNHFSLVGDVSFFTTLRQNRTFDGHDPATRHVFKGGFMNTSLGLNYYFGGEGSVNKVHADWFNRSHDEFATLNNRMDGLDSRVGAVEQKLDDHISDFNDHIRDANNNGIPDYMEDAIKDIANKNTPEYQDAMQSLINNYVSVFFPFDSSNPHNYSNTGINYVVDYMRNNPSASVTVKGYADEIGNSDYNQKLSQKRADRVKDILVAAGIDEGRISTEGQGEDTSVDKSSSSARQLVRRVIFTLN